ncbi:hypothetical protein MFRU_002g00480 [Monilinia fructicola]|nr:hypothetical protein MFRU_002g00480 [Monilinia fructicola]
MLPTTTYSIILLLNYAAIGLSSPTTARKVQGNTWPSTYAALGDSYASGHGAGHYFLPNTPSGDNKKCFRFDGSYPVQLAHRLDTFGDIWHQDDQFKFVACSGNVLKDVPNQISKLNGQRFELVTLSISGNDFMFGNVVENCVYNYNVFNRNAKCSEARDKSSDLIDGNAIWDNYKKVVRRIMDNVVDPSHGILVITGYPEFFARIGNGPDHCVDKHFPIPGSGGVLNGNNLYPQVRNDLNSLVSTVNYHIQRDIVFDLSSEYGGRIQYIDIDSGYWRHRFCEPDKKDYIGANDPDTFFISLGSDLQENDLMGTIRTNVSLSAFVKDNSTAFNPAFNNTDLQTAEMFLPNAIHRSSVFHPKRDGHMMTMESIKRTVYGWRYAHQLGGTGPTMECFSTKIKPPNTVFPNDSEAAVSPVMILDLIRKTLCDNRCEVPVMPSGRKIKPQAVNVRKGTRGLCEISVALEGGSEAYGLRDQVQGGDPTLGSRGCPIILQNLMIHCVNGGANEGWIYGSGENGFYQMGFREVNPTSGWHRHPQITSFLKKGGARS